MMKKCAKFEKIIMDNFYENKSGVKNNELVEHLKICQNCRKFKEDLLKISCDLIKIKESEDQRIEIDMKLIFTAMCNAEKEIKAKKDILEMGIFAVICLVFILIGAFLADYGYNMMIVYLYLGTIILSPFILIYNIQHFRDGERNG